MNYEFTRLDGTCVKRLSDGTHFAVGDVVTDGAINLTITGFQEEEGQLYVFLDGHAEKWNLSLIFHRQEVQLPCRLQPSQAGLFQLHSEMSPITCTVLRAHFTAKHITYDIDLWMPIEDEVPSRARIYNVSEQFVSPLN